jgi:ribosome-associated protein
VVIEIGPNLLLRDEELKFSFVRASGPGGQNVNKVATAAQLRFDVLHSPSLPDDLRIRLIRLAGSRMTSEGILIIDARRFRTQERNREDAIERLRALILRAAERPKPRRKTRPTLGAKKRRLNEKKQRGNTKRLRGRVSRNED